MPIYLSPKPHHVGHPLSNLRLCYLLHVSYLSDEACAHRVRVDCYLFTKSSSCHRSFFDWTTPVKLCSTVFCMLIDCLLHQFLGSIQKGVRVRVPPRMHVVNELKQQVVDVRLCLSAIPLTTCRLDNICKEVLNYFPDLLCVVCTYSPYFMIFSKSARESHTLPPAKLLWQNSTGLSSGLRLRSAFESFHRTPCRLASPCLFQLGNSQKFLSVHSTLPIPFGSNFLTLALHRFSVDGITLHRFSVDGSSRPFQSTRFRYSCKCNWMLWLSLCAFGTRT